MRIFIHEYVTIELANRAEVPASLRAEGWAMFAAVLEDFSRVPGVEVVTLPPARADLPSRFREAAARADWSLIIAPEFDDILYTRCLWVEEAGGRLLGPSSEAVRLTADKLFLSVHLAERGVPTPPTCAFLPGEAIHADRFPVVVKPRFGAGSLDTYLVRPPLHHPSEAAWSIPPFAGPASTFVLQPYVPGLAASIAFLIGEQSVLPLLTATQELARDRGWSEIDRLRYEGGTMPLPDHLTVRAVELGRKVLTAVPGLRGYVGVDLVLGGAPDGHQDQAIEINPRLTTSYIGLRALAKTNLAEAMLRMVEGESGVAVKWNSGRVRFGPHGAEPWQLVLL